MVKVFAQVDDRYVNPVFEVFDGDDFILSSYHDIEETTSQVQIYFPDVAQTDKAKRRKGERRKVGHRQQLTVATVTAIA